MKKTLSIFTVLIALLCLFFTSGINTLSADPLPTIKTIAFTMFKSIESNGIGNHSLTAEDHAYIMKNMIHLKTVNQNIEAIRSDGIVQRYSDIKIFQQYIEIKTTHFSFYLNQNGSYNDWNDGLELVRDAHIELIFEILPRPAISGEDVIFNNIDNPYTIEQIKNIADLKVFDPYYGDITSQIQISKDNYSQNKHETGSFPIEFTVTNPSNITTTYILTILNCDQTPPVITGLSNSAISYKTVIKNSDIIEKYAITDNHDANLLLALEKTNYVASKIGTFTFDLVVEDKAGNQSRTQHMLKVYDDISPLIIDNHLDIIILNYKIHYTENDLLLDLTALDEIDGDLTEQITIKSSDFISGRIGNYTVIYEVFDASGNRYEYTRNYKIETTENPVFYVSKTLLLIEDTSTMTIEQIITEMAKYENIDIESFKIVKDDYSKNKNKIGAYDIEFELTTKLGEVIMQKKTIKIFSSLPSIPSQSKTFWQQLSTDFINHLEHYWYYYAIGLFITCVGFVFYHKKKK